MRGKKRGKAEMGNRAPSPNLRTGVKAGKMKIKLGVCQMELLRKGRKARRLTLAVIFPAGAFMVVPRKMRLQDCEQKFPGAKIGREIYGEEESQKVRLLL